MSCYALGMRSVGIVAFVIGMIMSGCFNETAPTSTPPDVPPPSYPCYYFPTYPTDPPDSAVELDGATGADDAGDGAATLDAQSSYVEAGADASADKGICQPAVSVCANTEWVAYFDDGRCVGGTCNFTTKYHFCAGGCVGGLCAQHQSGFVGGTAPRPPPKW